jgi:hypothetical protein
LGRGTNEIDDLGARPRKSDPPDIQLLGKLRLVGKDALKSGTLGAIKFFRTDLGMREMRCEQKGDILSHGPKPKQNFRICLVIL